jgi:D-hexose-6-phosphate mutarotase
MIDRLNREFSIQGHVNFQTGNNSLPKAVIANQYACVELYLYGAHITSYKPHGAAEVLWMSNKAEYRQGKAIRGGVPVVWPWFGPHASDPTKPQHGFVRTTLWQVAGTSVLPDNSTQIRLRISDTTVTRSIWPHAFDLELRCTIGPHLRIELISRNTGSDRITIGGALHSYFAVGDIGLATINGLENRTYIDELEENRTKKQDGPISFAQEVDRIYRDSADTSTVVNDPVMDRTITVAKEGSNTTVVWNPWIAKSRRMADFPDDGFRTMVCVETTNAADDVRTLQPDGEHVMAQIISVQSGSIAVR